MKILSRLYPRNLDKANFAVAVVGVVATIVLWWLSNQSDLDIAEKSGSFNRPTLEFRIGSFRLKPSEEARVLFGAPKLSAQTDVVVATLPFIVSNSGSATLDDATVTFRFHKMFRRDVLEDLLKMEAAGTFHATEVRKAIFR